MAMDDETKEAFTLLFQKIEAQRVATSQVLGILVQRLARDGSLGTEMLLEHLYTMQSNLPVLGEDAPAGQRAIAKEVLETFRSYLEAIEQAAAAADEL